MKPETAHDLLVPYLEGGLDPATAARLEAHLATNPALRRELEQLRALFGAIAAAPVIAPDAGMRERFEALLAAEKRRVAAEGRPDRALRDRETPGRPRSAAWPHFAGRLPALPLLLRVAAAVALVAGGLAIGRVFFGDRSPADDATAAELQSLRRDVALLRGMLDESRFAERPASYRLQTVSLAGELRAPEPEVIDALFATLDGDESANVRLAALEALRRFDADASVRSRLVAALPRQHDPLVQIALIGVLVEARDPEARAPLERLLLRPDVSPIVKGQAQQGLSRL